MIRSNSEFPTVRSEGGLLPADLLRRVGEPDAKLPGVRAEDYGLPRRDRLGEVIAPAWSRLRRHWADFRAAAERLDPARAGTGLTNEQWTLPLLRELGFGTLPAGAGPRIEGRAWPIARFLGPAPVHLVGCNASLDRRAAGVRGAAGGNPHGLVQEFLNRSGKHLWAVVSNGLRLRILRDNASLSRQSFLEFDLEAMFEGEVYPDFVLLWLVAHATRFAPRDEARPESCLLEAWTREAREQGARALGDLRGGVERALRALGQGFAGHPKNDALRRALREGRLPLADLHGQLLRAVYRLIFLFVAEDRELEGLPLLHPPDRSEAAAAARALYAEHYGTGRLRRLAARVKGTRHGDLWRQFGVVTRALAGGAGTAAARRALALPALGGFLWSPDSTAALNGAELANADFLDALRHLAFFRQGRRQVLRAVDYRDLGAEELGGVYESLLALTPQIGGGGARFDFAEFSGNARKTTGAYYTPDSLVQCLLDSALDPVVAGAIRGKSGKAAEKAILDLKICDPAVGSGHFLIGAARRLARRLARVRAEAEGESEPSPLLHRRALRDVIGHCLYGVDINPMAAELCRVGLWLEALVPGKPLTFLDRRIRVGDSLLGVLNPDIMDAGIPPGAYRALTGDDKASCRDLKKRNEPPDRAIQTGLFEDDGFGAVDVALAASSLDAMPEDTVPDIERKQAAWEETRADEDLQRVTARADLFVAAFLAEKTQATASVVPITEDIDRLGKLVRGRPGVETFATRIRRRRRFFHWPVEFPDVMIKGGFDVVLGNPPWERIKLQEQEFFAARAPEIATAPNKAARERLIRALAAPGAPQEDKALYRSFQSAKHSAEGAAQFIRTSGRFPLTATGDTNTYALFAEAFLQLLAPAGRAGIIVQSGIATDLATSGFFRDISRSGRLASLYDFENRERLFPGIHSSMKFCLMTLGPRGAESADFAFFSTNVDHLQDRRRHFDLSPTEIRAINPNTRTMPVFRSQADAELTKKIYDRIPVLVDNSKGAAGNPWDVRFLRMFDMANDSKLFRTTVQLSQGAGGRDGMTWFAHDGTAYIPLYEAKMIHQFDHRWASYDGGAKTSNDVTDTEKADPTYEPYPRYWVREDEMSRRLDKANWDRGWLFGWRDVTNATNERSMITTIFPRAAVNHKLPLILPGCKPVLTLALCANLISLPFDYTARQKIGGTSLTYFYIQQFPVIPPATYDAKTLIFIVPRVLELIYTSNAMKSFALDMGYKGRCFVFDPQRRAVLRAELDAFFARLYGLTRDELRFILDPSDVFGQDYPTETFRVLKKNDIQRYGEYRTAKLVLQAWDRLAIGG